MKKIFPPYGAILAARQQFNNPPEITVICVGQNGWSAAKRWNARNDQDVVALVLEPGETPERFRWPVSGCVCVIEWFAGPGRDLIIRLIRVLSSSGAVSVSVVPKFTDLKRPAWLKIGGEWQQQREVIQTYANSVGGSSHA